VGLSLIEVLITMFVLSIGLMGVAAILPLGKKRMRDGAVSQRATELGERALETIDAIGVTDSSRYLFDPSGSAFVRGDGVSSQLGTRISCQVVDIAGGAPADPTATAFYTDAKTLGAPNVLPSGNDLFNGAYVEFIRPEAMQGRRWRILNQDDSNATYTYFTFGNGGFGASSPSAGDIFVVKRCQPFAVDPLLIASYKYKSGEIFNVASTDRIPDFAPGIRRLTLTDRTESTDAASMTAMNYAAAEANFVSGDDLRFTRPTDSKLPPQQEYFTETFLDANGDGYYNAGDGDTFTPASHDLNGDGFWNSLKRRSNSNFSWLATFVPAEGNIDPSYYQASVVVFYKRPIRIAIDETKPESPQLTLDLDFFNESGVNYGGGTATISTATIGLYEAIVDDVNNNSTYERDVDKLKIKKDQWVLVTAFLDQDSDDIPDFEDYSDAGYPTPDHPNDTHNINARTRWYRIASVGEPYFSGGWNVKVKLDGADWDAGDP
ncbi:MAG: hypothetical protein N2C12_08005, partial [Planctomycetales bacterium]